jgi:deazaflavin-dependent oxidoreductase (nitroreductase family)
LAIVTHTGRISGTAYETPVNIFRRNDGYLFAVTYGPEADWVKNVRVAGRCMVRTRGRDIALANPELILDPTRRLVPPLARWILGLVHVDHFLALTVDPRD